MKTIYVVYPFCKADRLPNKGTIDRIVFDNSYFFIGYSSSILYVRKYMDFIDALFGNVFHNLKYGIMEFDYPDDIIYRSDDMLYYIQTTYEFTLFLEQEVNRIVTEIPYNKKIVEFYMTDMMYYGQQMDYAYLGGELVDEDGYDFVREIFFYVNYTAGTSPIFEFLERLENIIDTVHVDNMICSDLYAVYELYIQVIRMVTTERRIGFDTGNIFG